MSANGKILYVGDTEPPAALDLVLEGQGYQITATDLQDAIHALRLREFEAMVVDQCLIQQNKHEWRELTGSYPGMPVLGISERVDS